MTVPFHFELVEDRVLAQSYMVVFYTLYLVQLVAFAYVLIEVRPTHSFASRIVLFNLLSVVASMASMALTIVIDPAFQSSSPLTLIMIVISGITLVLYAASFFLFNIALWLFGYHYFNCQAKLTFIQNRKEIPASFERC
jgi:hypothetical protein